MSDKSLTRCCHEKPRVCCDLCKRDDEIARLTAENAAKQAVVDAALTPKQMEALSRWMILHGDLDSNAVCLTALHLKVRAGEMRDALRALEGEP